MAWLGLYPSRCASVIIRVGMARGFSIRWGTGECGARGGLGGQQVAGRCLAGLRAGEDCSTETLHLNKTKSMGRLLDVATPRLDGLILRAAAAAVTPTRRRGDDRRGRTLRGSQARSGRRIPPSAPPRARPPHHILRPSLPARGTARCGATRDICRSARVLLIRACRIHHPTTAQRLSLSVPSIDNFLVSDVILVSKKARTALCSASQENRRIT